MWVWAARGRCVGLRIDKGPVGRVRAAGRSVSAHVWIQGAANHCRDDGGGGLDGGTILVRWKPALSASPSRRLYFTSVSAVLAETLERRKSMLNRQFQLYDGSSSVM